MRRSLSLLLILAVLALCLAGCGSAPAPETTPAPDSAPAPEVSVPGSTPAPEVSVPEKTPGPSTEATPAVSATPEVTSTPAVPAKPIAPTTPDAAAPTPEPEPYSVQTADTILTVTGSGVSRDHYFSLADLTAMSGGYVEADYFSRGKEPPEATTHFKGLRVGYLLSSVAGVSAGKVKFLAADGYGASYSFSAVNAAYLDETVPDKTLSMILAWEEDTVSCGLRLVMGQTIEGEYNRTNWVRDVITIEVSE